jgi:ribonuclease P protein component
MTQVPSNETHISAQQNKACQDPRFPRPHGDESRTPHPEAPPRQRPRTADAVSYAASITAASINPGLTSTSSGRFGKTRRLLDEKAFARVFRNASRSKDRQFTVLYTHNNMDFPRLGLAISKRHCRKATERNRVKRLIRESFRQHQAMLSGLDIVVMNQPATAGASNKTLFDSLEEHWRRCSKAKRTPRES